MVQLRTWISAFRLRTLPLATAAVLMGASLADLHHSMDYGVTFLCLLTAVTLQILSNLANDYGDFMKGTDSEQRLGNMRALQSGKITPGAMRAMIIVFVGLCLLFGIWLLLRSTEGAINYAFLLFFITGLLAIAAAIKYTVGEKAYGYSGFGDIAVFLFFGPVAVIGTFLLNTHLTFDFSTDMVTLLPASAIGLLCTGVLNTNNIRDVENDRNSGKNTIPVTIGLKKARIYHAVLIITGLVLLFAYSFIHNYNWMVFVQLPAAVFIIKNLTDVWRHDPSPAYNKFLKKLSLGILLFVIVYVITNAAAQVWNTLNELLKLLKIK